MLNAYSHIVMFFFRNEPEVIPGQNFRRNSPFFYEDRSSNRRQVVFGPGEGRGSSHIKSGRLPLVVLKLIGYEVKWPLVSTQKKVRDRMYALDCVQFGEIWFAVKFPSPSSEHNDCKMVLERHSFPFRDSKIFKVLLSLKRHPKNCNFPSKWYCNLPTAINVQVQSWFQGLFILDFEGNHFSVVTSLWSLDFQAHLQPDASPYALRGNAVAWRVWMLRDPRSEVCWAYEPPKEGETYQTILSPKMGLAFSRKFEVREIEVLMIRFGY